jgi:hypothetical protein
MPAFLHRHVDQLRFTLLAVAAMILPITASIAAASYCVSTLNIGGTVFIAIKQICFFAVLGAEVFVYYKFQRWRLSRKSHKP